MHANDATFIQPVATTLAAMSAGRLGAFVACALALAGVVSGGLALVRSRRRSRPAEATGGRNRPDAAMVAMALGLTGTALGGLVAVTSDGGVGTGNGLGGAIVGLTLGVLATLLAGLARWRSRPTPAGDRPSLPVP